ncbi:hypothetical protein BFP76_06470 [Amylibacter kogurei]|uniref:DUF4345 domain-containing protein n=2 Tax=Paramylibacter kogurei TaxID=1889778 RepID=A0A2G5K5K2_9RHOB|nr:hypothetical protein BFP76_06470 [Amylibacter kogurei]
MIVAIGASIYLFGIYPMAQIFAPMADILLGDIAPLDQLNHPDIDSEMRFLAIFYVAYGMIVLNTASDLRRRMHRIPLLATVVLLGAVGRGISIYFNGMPHGIMLILLSVEIVVPLFIIMLQQRAKRRLF